MQVLSLENVEIQTPDFQPFRHFLSAALYCHRCVIVHFDKIILKVFFFYVHLWQSLWPLVPMLTDPSSGAVNSRVCVLITVSTLVPLTQELTLIAFLKSWEGSVFFSTSQATRR